VEETCALVTFLYSEISNVMTLMIISLELFYSTDMKAFLNVLQFRSGMVAIDEKFTFIN
jgi:hypothetical protein